KYIKDVLIEARLCLSMARTMIFPAGVRYQRLLAQTAADLQALGKTTCTTVLDEVNALLAELQQAVRRLEETIEIPPGLNLSQQGRYLVDTVIPLMNALRKVVDELEQICDDGLWPLPTYQEMLFIR
ncbi:MAG TPA: glutamine synthetase type III, partial [Kiritimatiellia bacterium]|nr:glutamine synthetase type III [Kiritimatiellia bacterium]